MLRNIQRVIEMVGTETSFFEYRVLSVEMDQYRFPSWDTAARSRQREKYLYFLPEQSRVEMKGKPVADPELYMVDTTGKVYIYHPKIDAAIPVPGASVVMAEGTTWEPEKGECVLMTIMTALEMRSLLYDGENIGA